MSKLIKIGSAEISRRTLLAGVAAAGSAPILAMSVTPAMAKMSQAAVAYQDSPKGDRSGTISPNGWCKIWVKKAG
ncbi:MAG: hypothetical protein ABSE69_00890 [Roseiarcus sp.]